MKKIFKRSTKSKEKERQKIKRTQEDDFLYGRSKGNNNNGNNNNNGGPPPLHRNVTRNAQDTFVPPHDLRNNHPQQPPQEPTVADGSVGYNNNNNNNNNNNDYDNSTAYDNGNSTAYGEGNRPRYESSRTLGNANYNYNNVSSLSIADRSYASAPPQSQSSASYAGAPPPANANAGASPSSSLLGLGTGTTREEKDRRTKQRLKDERWKQSRYATSARSGGGGGGGGASVHSGGHSSPSKSTFDERLYQHSAMSNHFEGVEYEEDDYINNNNNNDNNNNDDTRSNDDESAKHPPTAAERELEDRRRKNRERADRDRKIKEGVRREQRTGERHPTGSAAADAELEEKRRRQREREEQDRKIKEEVRRHQTTSTATTTAKTRAERELEERRRRQREQRDQDKKLKESVRQQSIAAKELRTSVGPNGLHSARERGDRRDAGGGDADAARERNDAAADTDEGFEERRRKRRENNKSNKVKHVSIIVSGDAFEDDLQTLEAYERGGFAGTKEEEEEYLDGKAASEISTIEENEHRQSQNLIDMHIAQLKATSKISATEDEDFDYVDPNACLEEFEEQEAIKNRNRRISRRVSTTTMRINAWNEKITLKKAVKMAERSPEMEWLSSFYHTDPRYQIMKFFDEVARDGGKVTEEEEVGMGILAGLFNKASVFTVWRPTSDEAIKNMMTDRATGKGLDIKGKSAKRGNISSYVPFIQIYEEAHKEHVRAMIKDGKVVRVFYKSEKARFEAYEMILDIKDYMLFAAQDACRVLSDEYADPEEQELAMQHLMYDDVSLNVQFVDTFANSSTPVYGLDITERLFWESYVMKASCERPAGTEWDIGRNSEPAFMDMNLKSIRTIVSGAPRAVVYQMSEECPMDPRKLLLAYEEHGRVKPVVSDFDCFLLGSRGVKYKEPIPQDQIDLVKWSVKNISEVLDERAASGSNAGWMNEWFKVMKKAALKGYYPKTPKYGNGDPKSYEIVEVAVSRLQSTGCVRHGAECFNWWFPQEIDEDFLVISDTLPGNKKWKKVKVPELQDILIDKIDEGFTFPINPKWVLCDPGWRRVYDKLLASQKPNVQDSINCWLPPGTGLREQIDSISANHPHGFEGGTHDPADVEGTAQRDLMEENLERYVKVQRAWRKLRLLLCWIRFVREKRREREENERDAMDSSAFSTDD